jgi:hypothetical protein
VDPAERGGLGLDRPGLRGSVASGSSEGAGPNRSLEEAEELARRAVSLAETTDNLLLRADAQVALAEVLRVADRQEESRSHIEKAVELYERKGAPALTQAALGSLKRPQL